MGIVHGEWTGMKTSQSIGYFKGIQWDSMELNGIFNMILNGTMLIERFIMEVVGCLFSDRLKLYMYIESQSRHVA
jgi:hypothetical protein